MARARRAIALTVAVALAPVQTLAQTPTAEVAPAPATGTEAAPGSPAASIPATPRESPGTFTTQDGWTTPKPGPTTSGTPPERRWQIRQAPLAGSESSWGPPGGQMPEYAEFVETPEAKGPPPKGTPRIVAGAILGPLGLALAVAGIVGATTDMLGEQKRLSVPMVGVGVVASAIGWGLFADGILRRKKFMRWQAKGGQLTVAPALVPGRLAGVSLGLRF
ncbi:MAG TPA: hypothetical protein VGB85_28920 [Nannocystis sp.]